MLKWRDRLQVDSGTTCSALFGFGEVPDAVVRLLVLKAVQQASIRGRRLREWGVEGVDVRGFAIKCAGSTTCPRGPCHVGGTWDILPLPFPHSPTSNVLTHSDLGYRLAWLCDYCMPYTTHCKFKSRIPTILVSIDNKSSPVYDHAQALTPNPCLALSVSSQKHSLEPSGFWNAAVAAPCKWRLP